MRLPARRGIAGLAGAVLALAGMSLTIDPAGAADGVEITDTGWWWQAQPKGSPVTVPPPPTVRPRELLVQSAPSGATAYAAIAATLPDGHTNPIVTLTVVEDSTTGDDEAVVLACQAGGPWTGGDAQPWEDAPEAACDTASVTGQRSDDGKTWTFPAGPLQFGNALNMVLVPGVPEGAPEGTYGTFSLTFGVVDSDSIATSEGAAPPPPTLPPVDSGTSTDDFAVPDTSGDFAAPVDTPFEIDPVESALPDDKQGLTPIAPSVESGTRPQPLVPVATDDSSAARAVGALILLVGGGLAYWSAQQSVPGPRPLTRFVRPRAAAAGAAPTALAVGGLGRFSRERSGPPPTLRG